MWRNELKYLKFIKKIQPKVKENMLMNKIKHFDRVIVFQYLKKK